MGPGFEGGGGEGEGFQPRIPFVGFLDRTSGSECERREIDRDVEVDYMQEEENREAGVGSWE